MEHQVCTSCLNAYVQPILIPELRGAYSTDDEFHNYMRENFFPGSSDEDVAPLLTLYPNDPAQGSPFGTGDENQFAPMNKRVAAFQGDFFFESARRSLLTQRSDKQPAWTYSA